MEWFPAHYGISGTLYQHNTHFSEARIYSVVVWHIEICFRSGRLSYYWCRVRTFLILFQFLRISEFFQRPHDSTSSTDKGRPQMLTLKTSSFGFLAPVEYGFELYLH